MLAGERQEWEKKTATSHSMLDRTALKGEAQNGNYLLHDMERKLDEPQKRNISWIELRFIQKEEPALNVYWSRLFFLENRQGVLKSFFLGLQCRDEVLLCLGASGWLPVGGENTAKKDKGSPAVADFIIVMS